MGADLMMKSHLGLLCCVLGLVHAVPLEPGQPGQPWTDEEVLIVKEKIRIMASNAGKEIWLEHPVAKLLDEGTLDEFSLPHEGDSLGPRDTKGPDWARSRWTCKWKPSPGKLVQLGFHDCLKYKNGGGGCDGCLNWEAMGFKPLNFIEYNEKSYRKFPISTKTNNNKLQMTARSLELIYTLTDWPLSSPALSQTLRDSGKSRADLWQLAANVGLEMAVNETNDDCRVKKWHKQLHVTATEGWDKCEIKPHREIPFKYGRVDCVPDPKKKWTPYPFEATEEEKHSNPYGVADDVLKNLKEDFGLSARESISLMAAHGLQCQTHNYAQGAKYKWFGGWTLSNLYFKYLNGKTYSRGNPLGPESFNHRGSSGDERRPGGLDGDYFVGDKFGNPVDGTAWKLHCVFGWNTTNQDGGPCHFRPTNTGCRTHNDPDLDLRKSCFNTVLNGGARKDIPGCEDAKIDPVTLVQTGGPRENQRLCRNEGWSFGLVYEVSLVLNFTVDSENHPRGCGPLDKDIMIGQTPRGDAREGPEIYNGSPGSHGSPPCGPNNYAPEGETTSAIVASFADDHDLWARTFLDAWQKMQENGYAEEELKNGPESAGLLKYVHSVSEQGPMKSYQPYRVYVEMPPIDGVRCISVNTSSVGCSDGSTVDPTPVFIQNVKDSLVLTAENGGLRLRPFTGQDTQKWMFGLLCTEELSLVNVLTGQELYNGPWKYNCKDGLLQGENGLYAFSKKAGGKNKRFLQTKFIKFLKTKDTKETTNVPWKWYRWRLFSIFE